MDEWLEDVLERSNKALSDHLDKIIINVSNMMKAEYYVVFLRKDWNDIMTDVRAHDKVEKRWSWPLIDVRIFRNYNIEDSIWIGSWNTLRVLWQVEEWRLQCKNNNMKFFDQSPVIDENLLMGKNFINLKA
jgi:hypothetical protein